MERYQKIMVDLSESVIKNRPKRPPGGKLTMTSYPACNKTSLSRKPYIPDKIFYHGTLSGGHGRSFRIRHEKSREAPLAED